MEHFIACENDDRPRTSLESTGRMSVPSRSRGHLLDALNNRVWLVRTSGTKASPRIELQGVCTAAAICEIAPGELVLDVVDAIDFEPPVVLSDRAWFDPGANPWSKLRTGFARITEGVGQLLEIEHRERIARHRFLPREDSTGGVQHASRPAGARRETSHAHREKAAVQARAMASALEYYRLRWKNVEDVSLREAFELRCTDPKGRTLAVSVKGTTGSWETLLLTAAEEQHARQTYPDVALFILYGVGVTVGPDGVLAGRGGTTHVIDPWDISLDELNPLIFGCRIARTRATKHGGR